MAKRIVIFGKCKPDEDLKAFKALSRFVSDTQPDELVCIEQSIPFLEQLRVVYDGPIGVHARNARDMFGATALPDYYQIAPGWISTSMDDCCAVSRIAGNTALTAARKFNTCIVLGHTGRMGIGSHTSGYGGKVEKTLTGMEVGSIIDMKSLRLRVKTAKRDVVGSALGATLRKMNLQQGFGLLTVEGQLVKPETVPITRGRFTVNGRTWDV